MLTTGIKQIIINDSDDITQYDATNKALKIKGLPLLKAADVAKLSIFECKDSIPGQYDYALTDIGDYVAGDNFVVAIDLGTTRNQGEFADWFKDNHDPLVLQCAGSVATVAGMMTSIAAAITAMSDADKARYHISTATIVAVPTDAVRITMTEWSVFPKSFTINSADGAELGVIYARTIYVAPFEGRGLPKYLRENVQSNSFNNTSAYAIGNTQKINSNTRYTLMMLTMNVTSYVNNPSVVNGAPASKQVTYEVWIDEDIDIEAAAGKDIIDLDIVTGNYNTAGTFIGDSVANTNAVYPASQGDVDTDTYDFVDGTEPKLYVAEVYV